jgi:hypothetical protein
MREFNSKGGKHPQNKIHIFWHRIAAVPFDLLLVETDSDEVKNSFRK